jgi:hypothetical protein
MDPSFIFILETTVRAKAETAQKLLNDHAIVTDLVIFEDESTGETLYSLFCVKEQQPTALDILEDHEIVGFDVTEWDDFNRVDIVKDMDEDELLRTITEEYEIDPEMSLAAEEELAKRGKGLSSDRIAMLRRKARSTPKTESIATGLLVFTFFLCVFVPPVGIIVAVTSLFQKGTTPDGTRYFTASGNERMPLLIAILLGVIVTIIIAAITVQGL